MSQFIVRGRYKNRDEWQPFESRFEAENEDVAVEHAYASFGSYHGLKRTQVEIEEVEG